MKKRCLYAVSVLLLLIGTTSALAQLKPDWLEIGKTAEMEHQYEAAIVAYTEAIKVNPSSPASYFNRARLNYRLNPTECVSVLHDLNKTIDLDPDNADAYYLRGLVNFYMLNNDHGRKNMELAAALGHEKAYAFLHPHTSGAEKNGAVYVSLGSITPSGKPAIIQFDVNKADIKEPYRTLLDAIGLKLSQELTAVTVFITGHTDNTGSEEYNESLSLRRAETVQSYLVEQSGISPDRIIVRAYGETLPIASNQTEEGRAINRRADLIGVKR